MNEYLKEKGLFPNWRDELYDISTIFGGEVLLQIERASVLFFGMHGYAVHANAYCYIDGEVDAEGCELMHISKFTDIVLKTPEAFKFNCVFVALDFLIRHGVITGDDVGSVEICKILHS